MTPTDGIKTGTAALAAILAGVTMAGCTAKESKSADTSAAKPAEVTVDATDTDCKLSATEAGTGPTTFVITNNGTKVTEFYVYGEGGRVLGPFLKPMSHLVHTEYLLAGRTTRDPRQILRGVQRNQRRVLVGLDAKFLDKLVRVLGSWYQPLTTLFAKKGMLG